MKFLSTLLLVVSVGAFAAEPKTDEVEKGIANNAAKTASAKRQSQEPLSMSVTGTQDAPNVLYIVPWKTVDAVPQEAYVSSLLDEVFAPVDPVEFERSIRINDQLQISLQKTDSESKK